MWFRDFLRNVLTAFGSALGSAGGRRLRHSAQVETGDQPVARCRYSPRCGGDDERFAIRGQRGLLCPRAPSWSLCHREYLDSPPPASRGPVFCSCPSVPGTRHAISSLGFLASPDLLLGCRVGSANAAGNASPPAPLWRTHALGAGALFVARNGVGLALCSPWRPHGPLACASPRHLGRGQGNGRTPCLISSLP
jgi:hypothetical protein